MYDLGCPDVRVIQESPIVLEDMDVVAKIGMVTFKSITTRIFNMPLEDRCEDFGQIAVYNGLMNEHPHAFDLDDHHHFETGKPLRVCGNTYDMLSRSRYARYFTLMGDKLTHFGLFDCAFPNGALSLESGAACC
jgi:hypothetical protein